MKILSQKSLSKLKIRFKEDPKLIEKSFKELTNELGLSTVEKKYEIDLSLKLKMPIGQNQSELKDKENCILIHRILPNLSAADATDEALWVSLCLSNFKDYFLLRWPEKKYRLLHIFAASWRQRFRDNAIGRLWWSMYMSKNLDDSEPERFLDILLFNSDFRSSLLERSSSANANVVRRAILEISEQMVSKGHAYNRNKFRDFMKDVNFHSRRKRIHSLNLSQLKDYLSPLYLKHYE